MYDDYTFVLVQIGKHRFTFLLLDNKRNGEKGDKAQQLRKWDIIYITLFISWNSNYDDINNSNNKSFNNENGSFHLLFFFSFREKRNKNSMVK